MTGLALHADIDADALAAAFATHRRVRIQPFLADVCATGLRDHLVARTDWIQVVNSGDKVFELSRPARAAMDAATVAALDQAVANGARAGFQYRYETLRLPDGDVAPVAGEHSLGAFPRWLSSGPANELLRRITGAAIAFADGQATNYAAGDFLTGHDDAVPGKGRLAAYVLGLTPVWRVEWGGLLLFHGPGTMVAGEMPGYNSLDIFAVPQLHSVSAVTTSAACPRHAVTGWLRSDRIPG